MYPIVRDINHQARNIQWLEFELSNNCQYAKKHKWCPRSQDTRPLTFLRSDIVRKVIQFFKRYDFFGRIYFSGYNEPLIDPRLVDLVRYAKKHLPKCDIDMFTNGVACDEHLLLDVLEAGVNRIIISIYNESERERLGKIATKVKKKIRIRGRKIGEANEDIDDRLNVYSQRNKGLGTPCFIPTLYYFVRNNGDVNMCFWDWKYTQVFGNLYVDSIESTLLNENRLAINYNLVNSNRKSIPVCSGCRLPAYKCIREYQDRMKL